MAARMSARIRRTCRRAAGGCFEKYSRTRARSAAGPEEDLGGGVMSGLAHGAGRRTATAGAEQPPCQPCSRDADEGDHDVEFGEGERRGRSGWILAPCDLEGSAGGRRAPLI